MSGQMIIKPIKCPKCGELRFFPNRPGIAPYTTIFRCNNCGYELELEAED